MVRKMKHLVTWVSNHLLTTQVSLQEESSGNVSLSTYCQGEQLPNLGLCVDELTHFLKYPQTGSQPAPGAADSAAPILYFSNTSDLSLQAGGGSGL